MKPILAGLAAAILLAAAAPASAAGPAKYLDNRSTAVTLVRSLYNAVNRHEYLRAWSYFSEDAGQGSFESFAKGYENTKKVRVKLGKPVDDGAAGSIFTNLPVVIEATGTDRKKSLFRLLRNPLRSAGQPGDAAFRAAADRQGELAPATESSKKTDGSCLKAASADARSFAAPGRPVRCSSR